MSMHAIHPTSLCASNPPGSARPEDGWRCRRRMIWQVSVLPACRRLASSALSHRTWFGLVRAPLGHDFDDVRGRLESSSEAMQLYGAREMSLVAGLHNASLMRLFMSWCQ